MARAVAATAHRARARSKGIFATWLARPGLTRPGFTRRDPDSRDGLTRLTRRGSQNSGGALTRPDSVSSHAQYGASGGLLNEDREPVCRLMQRLQFQHTGLEFPQAMQLHDIVEGLQLTTAVFARADLGN